MSDLSSLRASLIRAYVSGVDGDRWGQSDEAIAAYEKLSGLIQAIDRTDGIQLSHRSRTNLYKLATCARHRAALLRHRQQQLEDTLDADTVTSVGGSGGEDSDTGIGIEDMIRLRSVIERLGDADEPDFPLVLDEADSEDTSDDVVAVIEEQNLDTLDNGSLSPPPALSSGQTGVVLHIDRIGVKDAGSYVKPYLNIVVSDVRGHIAESQHTPHSSHQEHPYIHFGATVYLSTTLETMAERSLSVFVELRHWKATKQKTSVRCFAIIEPAELRRASEIAEIIQLELYHKPTNFTKHKLRLHSVKPLYLQMRVELTTK